MNVKVCSTISMTILILNLIVSYYIFHELLKVSPYTGITILAMVGILFSTLEFNRTKEKHNWGVMILLHSIAALAPLLLMLIGYSIFGA